MEPFLKQIGFNETDWIRQMTVSMGRGERNYPDYAFNAQTRKGDEKADMILEAKYRISTKNALTEAYRQAKSYSLRLQCKTFVLAAIEGIWIYPGKSGYHFEHFIQRNWKELENPDVLHEVRKMLGK